MSSPYGLDLDKSVEAGVPLHTPKKTRVCTPRGWPGHWDRGARGGIKGVTPDWLTTRPGPGSPRRVPPLELNTERYPLDRHCAGRQSRRSQPGRRSAAKEKAV